MEARMKAQPGAYTARIMAALPNQEPVELFRTSARKLDASDWNFWSRGLEAWQVWIERRCPAHRLLGGRRLSL